MSGTRRGATGFVVAMAAAASLLSAGAAQADEVVPSPPKADELRVISWNICGEAGGERGNKDRPGYCPHRNEPALKMKAIADLAKKQQADVVMLQEACGYTQQPSSGVRELSHQWLLEAELPGWTIVHAVGDRGARDENGNLLTDCRTSKTAPALGGDLGVLLAVKGAVPREAFQSFGTAPATLGAEDFASLPAAKQPTAAKIASLSGLKRPALCVRKEGWPDKICTAHLLAGSEGTPESVVRGMQAQEIRTRLGAEFGSGLVMGGDFNARETDPSLAPIAGGLARYVNDEDTHLGWAAPVAIGQPGTPVPHRYDHVFASRQNRFTSVEVDESLMDRTDPYTVVEEPDGVFSDHAAVITTVRRVPGDLNGDARPDLLGVDGNNRLRLYPGDGTGGLGASVLIGTSDWAGASVTHRGDWTGDGTEDIVARVGGEVRLFPNPGDGRISGHTVLATGLPATAKIVAVGDATGDGFPDLVAQYGDGLHRYDGVPGTAAGAPVSLKAPVNLGTGGWDGMTLTAPGDADGDGRVDLLARRKSDGKLWLYHGRDGGSFGSTGTRTQFGSGYTEGNRPRIAGGADANGDGVADMWATTGDGRLLFYPGGTDATGNAVDLTPGSSPVEVAATGWSGIGSMG
ncbi:FG-GAP-like repeat-containing protein [Streptomyces sp. NPDC096339]|uniref:FG-GAP-like repeat-containing protein n=1 Tax=Streptomyces sp. NPDC096339 TaxID=3366086 RepID=UPI0037F64D6C